MIVDDRDITASGDFASSRHGFEDGRTLHDIGQRRQNRRHGRGGGAFARLAVPGAVSESHTCIAGWRANQRSGAVDATVLHCQCGHRGSIDAEGADASTNAPTCRITRSSSALPSRSRAGALMISAFASAIASTEPKNSR